MSSDHDQHRHTAMQGALRATSPSLPALSPTLLYATEYGHMILGQAEDALTSDLVQRYKGTVQLVFTSPPFPLNHKKKYGNLQGEKYVAWLASFAQPLAEMLAPDGSIVIELGNAWEPGKPVMSTLALEALLAFRKAANLYLCQQFVCNNPARLPGPAQWVNVERIRVKDSFTHLWWMAPTTRPKADNRRVLVKYSEAMESLLKTAGAPRLDGIYFCPHHPNATLATYRSDCDCRKPRAGLFLRAARELDLDLSRSFAVGDRLTDIIAGARAGCRTVLVETGKHLDPAIETVEPLDTAVRADYTCADLAAAASWILTNK